MTGCPLQDCAFQFKFTKGNQPSLNYSKFHTKLVIWQTQFLFSSNCVYAEKTQAKTCQGVCCHGYVGLCRLSVPGLSELFMWLNSENSTTSQDWSRRTVQRRESLRHELNRKFFWVFLFFFFWLNRPHPDCCPSGKRVVFGQNDVSKGNYFRSRKNKRGREGESTFFLSFGKKGSERSKSQKVIS